MCTRALNNNNMLMCVHVCVCGLHSFQYRLKAKGSRETLIIMSLKRVTSGTWGPSSNIEYPPPFLLCPLWQWQSTLMPQQSAHPSCGSEVWCVCVSGCGRGGGGKGRGMNRWQPSGNGWGMFWMGNMPSFLTEYLGVCPSPVVQEAQRGRERWNENRWWFVI